MKIRLLKGSTLLNTKTTQCDITDENQIKALVQKLKSENNMVDVLINNAEVFEFMNQATEEINFQTSQQIRSLK